jgi:hypothetical protein
MYVVPHFDYDDDDDDDGKSMKNSPLHADSHSAIQETPLWKPSVHYMFTGARNSEVL